MIFSQPPAFPNNGKEFARNWQIAAALGAGFDLATPYPYLGTSLSTAECPNTSRKGPTSAR